MGVKGFSRHYNLFVTYLLDTLSRRQVFSAFHCSFCGLGYPVVAHNEEIPQDKVGLHKHA